MNILVTLDENYLNPLRTMLWSLHQAEPDTPVTLWLIHSRMRPDALETVRSYCDGFGWDFCPCEAGEELFADAPVFRHYTKAMYYRLLASRILPDSVDKVLYLDPDILILNPVSPLLDLPLEGNLFAAAIHSGLAQISAPVNRVRLHSDDDAGYFNSGVLVMDLAAQRRELDPAEIFAWTREHANELILPDQDILNALYGPRILPLDDTLYNYDARQYDAYRLLSAGEKDMDWVMQHTAILHFCGRLKPWKPGARGRFVALYKYCAVQAARQPDSQELPSMTHMTI